MPRSSSLMDVAIRFVQLWRARLQDHGQKGRNSLGPRLGKLHKLLNSPIRGGQFSSLSLIFFVCFYLSLSLSVYASVHLSVSLSLAVSLSVSLSLALPISVYLALSLYLSIYLSFVIFLVCCSLSLGLSLALFLSFFFLSLPLFPSLSLLPPASCPCTCST